MKAALFYGGKDIRVEDVPTPEPEPGEVLVRVRSAGVCGSDLHNYRGNRPPSMAVPWQQGHELAGEVASLGAGVSGLSVGQRVGIEAEHLVGCARYRYCAAGQYHICPDRGVIHGQKHGSHGYPSLPAGTYGRSVRRCGRQARFRSDTGDGARVGEESPVIDPRRYVRITSVQYFSV